MHSPDPLLAEIDRVIAERLAAQGSVEDEEALRLEGDFVAFIEAAWPHVDPSPYQSNWAIDGLAQHLEAVANGALKRLPEPKHSVHLTESPFGLRCW